VFIDKRRKPRRNNLHQPLPFAACTRERPAATATGPHPRDPRRDSGGTNPPTAPLPNPTDEACAPHTAERTRARRAPPAAPPSTAQATDLNRKHPPGPCVTSSQQAPPPVPPRSSAAEGAHVGPGRPTGCCTTPAKKRHQRPTGVPQPGHRRTTRTASRPESPWTAPVPAAA
jgi:hypothetical protein